MAKRYAISPISLVPDPEIGNHVTVDDAPDTIASAVIPTNPNTGAPLYRFAFCYVGTAQLPAVEQVSNVYVFPDYPLDGQLSGMGAEARAAMVQNVAAYDLDGNGLHWDTATANLDTNTYRQFLQALIDQVSPGVPVGALDVQEP